MKYLVRNKITNVIELMYEFPLQVVDPQELMIVQDEQWRNNMLDSIFVDEANYKSRPTDVNTDGVSYWQSDGTDWVDNRTDEEVWKMVRQRRNVELLESDWTQLDDAPLTSPGKVEWTKYRAELRDVPNRNTNPRAAEIDLQGLIDTPGTGKKPKKVKNT